MKKLVIITHPDIANSQINRAWVEALARQSDQFTLHALYERYPSLQFDIESEQELLERHEEIIFQFPIHWYSTPFALKKYFDEVFAYGWAFGPGGDRLQGKQISFAISTGGDRASYEQGLSVADLINDVLLTFEYCGCKVKHLHLFHGAMFDPAPAAIAANARAYVELMSRSKASLIPNA